MLHRLPSRLARPTATSLLPTARVPLATRTPLRQASTAHDDHGHGHGAGGHDDHYDPPAGWLWGQRPGEKAEKEGWEGLAWVFVASWVVAIAAYTMKEDTS